MRTTTRRSLRQSPHSRQPDSSRSDPFRSAGPADAEPSRSVMLLRVRRVLQRGGGKQIATIGESDLIRVANRAARTCKEAAHGHLRTRLDVALRPSRTEQCIRRTHLEPPRNELAIGSFGIDEEPRVRVRPLEPADLTL